MIGPILGWFVTHIGNLRQAERLVRNGVTRSSGFDCRCGFGARREVSSGCKALRQLRMLSEK